MQNASTCRSSGPLAEPNMMVPSREEIRVLSPMAVRLEVDHHSNAKSLQLTK